MLVGGLEKESGREHSAIPAAITDTGCERELNEDRYALIESPSGVAWLVCDGMGGAAGGELAAQIAIESIRRDLVNFPPRQPELAIKSAILESNRVIVLRRQNQAFSQMGTTVVGVIFSGPEIAIGHVGDSRAYLIREGAIQQLTTDHTFVQELVDRGEIKAEEALSHPQAHVLTRAIGAEPNVEVDVLKYWLWPVNAGSPTDHLLLCTDGLYSLLNEGEIAAIVSEESPQMACAKLVEIAKSRGGFDNITAAIIPLGGQLRQEPPPGYDGESELRKRLRNQMQLEESLEPRSQLRFIITIVVLCAMAALLTFFGVIFSLSR